MIWPNISPHHSSNSGLDSISHSIYTSEISTKSRFSRQIPDQSRLVRESLSTDPELWYPEGNCDIYLYQENQSLRGPSFRLPYRFLSRDDFDIIDQLHNLKRNDKHSAVSLKDQHQYSRISIYLPAPKDATVEQTYEYHTTTRNCFRCLANKPLVGSNLGMAYIAVVQRLEQWTGSRTRIISMALKSLKNHGYLKFPNNPEHAAVALFLAERLEISSLWTDAFAHCIDLFPTIKYCSSFNILSYTTSTSLSTMAKHIRPRIEAEAILLMAFDALPSDIHLSLHSDEYDHLLDLMSLLSDHFTEKLSAQSQSAFGNDWTTCYLPWDEIHVLYDTLANKSELLRSLPDWDEQMALMINGLSILDATKSFKPLPHMMPQRSSIHGIIPRKHLGVSEETSRLMDRVDKLYQTEQTLPEAHESTSEMPSVLANPTDSSLLMKYHDFESRESRTISTESALLLDWTMIYSMLQTLLWINSTVEGVRKFQSTRHSLYTGDYSIPTPPWEESNSMQHEHNPLRITSPCNKSGSLNGKVRREFDTESYHQAKEHSTSPSHSEGEEHGYTETSPTPRGTVRSTVPAHDPVRPQTTSRNNSYVKLASKSLVIKTDPASRRRSGYIEIIIPKYGNGMQVGEEGSDVPDLCASKGIKKWKSRLSWSNSTVDSSPRSSMNSGDLRSPGMSLPSLYDSSSCYSQSVVDISEGSLSAAGDSNRVYDGTEALKNAHEYECQIQDMDTLADTNRYKMF